MQNAIQQGKSKLKKPPEKAIEPPIQKEAEGPLSLGDLMRRAMVQHREDLREDEDNEWEDKDNEWEDQPPAVPEPIPKPIDENTLRKNFKKYYLDDELGQKTNMKKDLKRFLTLNRLERDLNGNEVETKVIDKDTRQAFNRLFRTIAPEGTHYLPTIKYYTMLEKLEEYNLTEKYKLLVGVPPLPFKAKGQKQGVGAPPEPKKEPLAEKDTRYYNKCKKYKYINLFYQAIIYNGIIW